MCSGPKHWNKLPDIIKCAPSLKVFKKFSILSIYDLCLLQILVFIYKSINLLFPNSYTQYFTRTSDIHYYKTRGHKYYLYKLNAQKHAAPTPLRVVDLNTGINCLISLNVHLP